MFTGLYDTLYHIIIYYPYRLSKIVGTSKDHWGKPQVLLTCLMILWGDNYQPYSTYRNKHVNLHHLIEGIGVNMRKQTKNIPPILAWSILLAHHVDGLDTEMRETHVASQQLLLLLLFANFLIHFDLRHVFLLRLAITLQGAQLLFQHEDWTLTESCIKQLLAKLSKQPTYPSTRSVIWLPSPLPLRPPCEFHCIDDGWHLTFFKFQRVKMVIILIELWCEKYHKYSQVTNFITGFFRRSFSCTNTTLYRIFQHVLRFSIMISSFICSWWKFFRAKKQSFRAAKGMLRLIFLLAFCYIRCSSSKTSQILNIPPTMSCRFWYCVILTLDFYIWSFEMFFLTWQRHDAVSTRISIHFFPPSLDMMIFPTVGEMVANPLDTEMFRGLCCESCDVFFLDGCVNVISRGTWWLAKRGDCQVVSCVLTKRL